MLGENRRAGGKIERRQTHLTGNGRTTIAPAKPAGNHQVQHDEQVRLHREDDSLADAAERDDPTSLNRAHRRLDRAHDERIPDAQPLQGLLQHTRAQRFNIDRYVGQLGQLNPRVLES